MEDNSLHDDLTGDLAAAVRKSWSESQHTARKPGNMATIVDSGNSPIGTPISEPFEESSINTFHTMSNDAIAYQADNGQGFKQPSFAINEITQPVNVPEPDYQLFKHHYSISDDHRDSVVDILHDLELELLEPSPVVSNESHQVEKPYAYREGNAGESRPSISKKLTTTRRGSIQDVQWIRQLLNPRSSFSGSSSNEPRGTNDTMYNNNQSEAATNNSNNSSKCWVTVLKDDSIASVKSVIVLSESIRLTGSKYPLYIIHDAKIDMSKFTKYHIASIPVSLDIFVNIHSLQNNCKWLVLSLFINLVNLFDLVCYISPSCMVIENIDELLDSNEICNEIDNETCVLLTNVLIEEGQREPQLMILKPNNEVSMCIKEYFTIYGDNMDEKLTKLSQMNDFDVLRELFHEIWGEISSTGYLYVLQNDEVIIPQSNHYSKIVDFKSLEPWNKKTFSADNNNTMSDKWYEIWHNFWKNVR